MQPKYQYREETINAAPVRQNIDGSLELEIDGRSVSLTVERHAIHHSTLLINGRQQEVFTAQDGDKIFVHIGGKAHELKAASAFAEAGGSGPAGGQIKAPMPGVMLECHIAEGDEVEEGQSLLLIESMKLQTEILAPSSGRISHLGFEAGQSFEKSAVLVAIESPDAEITDEESK